MPCPVGLREYTGCRGQINTLLGEFWSAWRGSNPRSSRWQRDAIPTSLQARCFKAPVVRGNSLYLAGTHQYVAVFGWVFCFLEPALGFEPSCPPYKGGVEPDCWQYSLEVPVRFALTPPEYETGILLAGPQDRWQPRQDSNPEREVRSLA